MSSPLNRLDRGHAPDDLIAIFNELFADTENTRLVRGDDEPVYIPAGSGRNFHQIVFAHGFFASALHEIAHWCIAGQQRRQLLDYGYWYAPDGRDRQQQAEFEQVEVKPQALEWIFCMACHKPFRISVDNLNGEPSDPEPFKRAVYQQLGRYCQAGLPARAQRLVTALSAFYGVSAVLDYQRYSLKELG